jgi:hypothetical protein
MMSNTANFVITYTFSTCGENHVGNEQVGKMREGFNKTFFENLGKSEDGNIAIHNLATNTPVPQDMDAFLATYDNFCGEHRIALEKEAKQLYWDEHKWDSDTRTVQAKHARSNTILCFPETLPSYTGELKMPDFDAYQNQYNYAIIKRDELYAANTELISKIEGMAYADKVKFRKTLSKEQNDMYTQYETFCKQIKAIPNGIDVTKHAIAMIKILKVEPFLLQYPDYLKGKGTIYNIEKLPYTKILAEKVMNFCAHNGYKFDRDAFVIEGNNYHDVDKCYIGFHGDTEREVVFGVRLGNSQIPLFYGWWHKNALVPNSLKCFVPKSGDAYMMSRKAVGMDWGSSSIFTLRHAAGDILTLEKQKSLETLMKKDQFFINRILDPTSQLITYLSQADRDFALGSLKRLYIQNQKKNNNKKSAEQTLIDKYNANEILYRLSSSG